MLRNSMDADDVTQEVLIRLWKNLDNFNLNAAGSYIMRMTHNLCIDYLRRRNISANREIEIDNVDCISKSYPQFLEHFKITGGRIIE